MPPAIAVTTANISDHRGALEAIAQNLTSLSAVASLLGDGGYTGQPFAEAVQHWPGAAVQVPKRHELHTLGVLAQWG
ncbi:transposase (fragment) [Candidatus Methylobacter favarea]|uniref:Transposase n=1 Tax=Candidatus Methylobacter favarea TaxID=2707345 RepID=A0A8S0XVL4_9GAMM